MNKITIILIIQKFWLKNDKKVKEKFIEKTLYYK